MPLAKNVTDLSQNLSLTWVFSETPAQMFSAVKSANSTGHSTCGSLCFCSIIMVVHVLLYMDY